MGTSPAASKDQFKLLLRNHGKKRLLANVADVSASKVSDTLGVLASRHLPPCTTPRCGRIRSEIVYSADCGADAYSPGRQGSSGSAGNNLGRPYLTDDINPQPYPSSTVLN